MKILKEIRRMYEKLPENEVEIFTKIFGSIDSLQYSTNHKRKQIIYNLLSWRTSSLIYSSTI